MQRKRINEKRFVLTALCGIGNASNALSKPYNYKPNDYYYNYHINIFLIFVT